MIITNKPEPSAGGMDCRTGDCRGSKTEQSCIPRWKRGLDLLCIALTLPLWLPLMLLIAVGIELVSPGPILFRQERVGYRGRRFICFKFRSMRVNAETRTHEDYMEHLMQADRPMTKLDAAGDKRLIPFGRIFRATGLDELPQLFNVIRGEMSLVGPRPCTSKEAEHYTTHQQQRFNVAPGLTGYWQVNGKNKTTFREMIDMDILYANTMSLRMDIWILFKTVPSITYHLFEQQIIRHIKHDPDETFRKQVSQ